MDPRSLELFLHLARTLHFGKTSRECHVSPSALSRTIQRMEAELGSELFARDRRSVELTPAGGVFETYASETLARFATLRRRFDEHYSGGNYVTYGLAQANEIVSKGIALFVFNRGDPRAAIVSAVNFGRDTDCLAAVAGGLCGALSGAHRLPPEWIDQVDAATRQDPYTNNRRTIGETADALYEAFQARQARLAAYVEEMRRDGR